MVTEKTKKALVIHYFLTEHNNTSPAIAKLLHMVDGHEIKIGRVDRIITQYLSNKTIHE